MSATWTMSKRNKEVNKMKRKRTFAVLADVIPNEHNDKFFPEVFDHDGCRETLRAKELIEIKDGEGSVYETILTYSPFTFDEETANQIADKFWGEVVEVLPRETWLKRIKS